MYMSLNVTFSVKYLPLTSSSNFYFRSRIFFQYNSGPGGKLFLLPEIQYSPEINQPFAVLPALHSVTPIGVWA